MGPDFRYRGAFTNSSNFGFADLSNNAQRGSSHSQVLEQSSEAGTGLSNTDSVHQLNYMPAGTLISGSSRQCGTQGQVSGLTSNQTTMHSSLTDLQDKHGLNPDPGQHVSTFSSSQHDRPVQKSDMNKMIRKRPSSRQPTNEQHLSALRRFAKKSGVPEDLLGTICPNTGPQPKRPRTSSQKRNKKDVENVGGACFLCLVSKKKVFRLKIRLFHELSHTNLSLSAPVSGPVTLVERTGRSVLTARRLSCGHVTSIQS